MVPLNRTSAGRSLLLARSPRLLQQPLKPCEGSREPSGAPKGERSPRAARNARLKLRSPRTLQQAPPAHFKTGCGAAPHPQLFTYLSKSCTIRGVD